VHNEPFLRLNPTPCDFGGAHGHPQLASEMPVLYAGEIEVGPGGAIIRWSNKSGEK